MNILERAARLLPGDRLEADGGLHRIMVIERHKDFVWLGCAKHRDFWLPNNLEVWIDVPAPRQFKELEHVLIEKVDQLLRDML